MFFKNFKNRLIVNLGGITPERFKSANENYVYVYSLFQKALQDVCFKGIGPDGPTYYDWACDYCCRPCNKRNGWCDKFVIGSKNTIFSVDNTGKTCSDCIYFDNANDSCTQSKQCLSYAHFTKKEV